MRLSTLAVDCQRPPCTTPGGVIATPTAGLLGRSFAVLHRSHPTDHPRGCGGTYKDDWGSRAKRLVPRNLVPRSSRRRLAARQQALRFELLGQRQRVVELEGAHAEGAGGEDVFDQIVDVDGVLRKGSKHFQGAAVDLRIRLG